MRNNVKAMLLTLAAIPLISLLTAGKSPAAQSRAEIRRGEYLVKLGGCSDCHTPKKMGPHGPVDDLDRFLSGHPESPKLPPPPAVDANSPWFASTAGMTAWSGPWGISYAANLTPDQNTGLGIWTEEMFIKALRTGKHFGVGRDILPPMPWENYKHASEADLKAIFAYLKSVKPVSNHVPDPQPPGGARNVYQ